MLRWLAAGGAAVLLVVAAITFLSVNRTRALPAPPPQAAASATPALPGPVAEAIQTPEQREAKRLSRYDHDKDGVVSRDEYLKSRQRAFAKLDADGDGKLSFAEYSAKAIAKFEGADADKSGALSDKEFATTAVARKASRKVACPPTAEADS